jgi:hypothetical protein
MGKTGDRVVVLTPPDLRDDFSGYHPLDGLSSPLLLDPVYPFLMFWRHFLLINIQNEYGPRRQCAKNIIS